MAAHIKWRFRTTRKWWRARRDFQRINHRYVRYLKIIEERPDDALRNLKSAICNLKSSEAWAAGPDTAIGLSGATSLQLILARSSYFTENTNSHYRVNQLKSSKN